MSKLFGSVRTPILGVSLVLAILALIPATSTLRSSWTSWEEHRAAAEMNKAAARLNEGLFELLLERAQSNAALASTTPVGDAARGVIARHRGVFQAKLAEALVHLREARLPETVRMLQELEGMTAPLEALRRRADAQMALADEARDAEFARGGMHRELSRFVAAQQGIWSSLLAAAGEHDPLIARLNMLKQASWLARDASGQERSTVAGAIAANRGLTPQNQAAVAQSRGAVDSAWRLLEAEPETRTDPRLAAAVAAARTAYFTEFRALSTAQAEPSADRMAASAFIERTTPQIGSLLLVRDAASLVTQERADTLIAQARAQSIAAIAVLGGTLLFLAVAVWVVLRRVLAPLASLQSATGRLAAGAYDDPVPATARTDEFGALARGLDTLRQEALRARALEEAAAAQRTATAEEARRARASVAQQIETALGTALDTMADRVEVLRGATAELRAGAGQTARLADAVNQDADQASRNVQTVAAAAEELSASVSEITRQVAEAARVAGRAMEETRATDATMAALTEAATKIGEVVRLISDIAGQTNLLALNATIEAARAGEAGKGFAVVASEVKSLAAQTGRATGDIAAQISAIQGAAEGAVRSIQGIGTVVAEINEVANAIAAAVEEQGAATREIARNVAEAATGTDRVAARMDEVGQGAQAAEGALTSLAATTDDIAQQGEGLRGELSTLLTQMRAA
ncbi:methyl-accepting chemotaxis protein [Roseococcus microcysteis]|uniref:methyl-accepting chemotaxis protein n=1 Tax=Roseococcus microcysteis TaxID=2771361 RepID=UPI00168BE9FD|nr:HAMP domain-containing methyl-accepting chemotaxis protein [Roseococcus microcysteis]